MGNLLKIPWTRYISHVPTPKQLAFLLLPHPEALFGGSAGGGKSDCLLMAALQYVNTPGYSALLLRRTYAELSMQGGLVDRAREWLGEKNVHWREMDRRWTFPSGATLAFGYLDSENDKFKFQSTEFQFCGFDELTTFRESQYRYLFSRLRRLAGSDVPLRMRAASNPGGVGHDWVKARFVDGPQPFLRATLADNPHLDRDAYVKSLSYLDPVTRQQLLNGDWSARMGGEKFRREWFRVQDEAPADIRRWVRCWDLAATTPRPGIDPDWTAGVKVGELRGTYYIADIRRVRGTPQQVEALIKQTASLDGRGVDIFIEREPGAGGIQTIDYYQRQVLPGYSVRGIPSTQQKEIRANPVSSAAEAGNVRLINGQWIPDFLDEAEIFPLGSHDDQIDALSLAVSQLTRSRAGVGLYV